MKSKSGVMGKSLPVNGGFVKLFVDQIPDDSHVLLLGWAGDVLMDALAMRAIKVTVLDKSLPDSASLVLLTSDQVTFCHEDPIESLERILKREKVDWIVSVLPPLFNELLLKRLALRHVEGGLLLVCRREHADALLARPYERMYGWLTLMMRHHYDGERLKNLTSEDFMPPLPWQTAVVMKTHGRRPLCHLHALDLTLKLGFRKRHRMVGQTFATQLRKTDWMELVIDPESKPERLSYAQWAGLAHRLYPGELGRAQGW